MLRKSTILIFLVLSFSSKAQPLHAIGEAEVALGPHISMVEATNLAERNARQRAVETLGLVISRRSIRTVENTSSGESTKYNSAQVTSAVGEWLYTAAGYPKFTVNKAKGTLLCVTKGAIRKYEPLDLMCLISFGRDSNQFVFHENEEIQVNVWSDKEGFVYVFAEKIESPNMQILHEPSDLLIKSKGLSKPLIIGVSLDDKSNESEEYRFVAVISKTPLDFFNGEEEKMKVPDGYEATLVLKKKHFYKKMNSLIASGDLSINEQPLSIIQ